jgi:hypothetical protein
MQKPSSYNNGGNVEEKLRGGRVEEKLSDTWYMDQLPKWFTWQDQ